MAINGSAEACLTIEDVMNSVSAETRATSRLTLTMPRRAAMNYGLRLAMLAALGSQGVGRSQDRPPASLEPQTDLVKDRRSNADSSLYTSKAIEATRRGLDWLVGQQDPDGSFHSELNGRNSGVVALAGLAFLSHGDTPGRGGYGKAVLGCLEYLIDTVNATGLLSVRSAALHGPMYEHGFATMFLAEAYGMSNDRRLRAVVTQAIALILSSQNAEGGWRYQPLPEEADISVTVCQMMALRAARNAGIYVPIETVEKCVAYVRKSQNPDGGFMYLPTGGVSDFPRSAAGIAALFSAGIYTGPEIDRGLDYLRASRARQGRRLTDTHFLYGHYYATQVMWMIGGEEWRNWYPAIRDALLERQTAGGSWLDGLGQTYGTAMASIILQMPNNYLPIFQR